MDIKLWHVDFVLMGKWNYRTESFMVKSINKPTESRLKIVFANELNIDLVTDIHIKEARVFLI